MAESRRKKKSKSRHGDDCDIEGQVNTAMEQVEQAMKQVRMAEKQAHDVNKAAKRQAKHAATGSSTDKADKTGARVFTDAIGNIQMAQPFGAQPNTFINIASANSIQVGCHNTTYIEQVVKPRRRDRDRPRRSESDDEKLDDARDRKQTSKGKTDSEVSPAVTAALNCERLVTTVDMKLVSIEIGANWRRFFRCLDMDDETIEQLHENYRDGGIQNVLYKGLEAWKRKGQPAATLGTLAKVLVKISRVDVVEKLTP